MVAPPLVCRVVIWALLWILLLSGARAQIAPVTGPVGDIVAAEATAAGLDPVLMRRIAAIESGGDCSATTGRYRGLFQLSYEEFRGLGGTSISDCRQNAHVAMLRFRQLDEGFRDRHGRAPAPVESYLMHQQGEAGLDSHLAHPERLAWISMMGAADSSENWAKAAIWGNVPGNLRPKFKSVDLVTSSDFVNLWRVKVEGERAPKDSWASPRECRPLFLGRLRP